MPSDEVAVSVRGLTKTYRLFGHPGDRIKQFFSLGLKRYHREFTALREVSLDIRKGETVGILGRNGSGKSTLLQLICGILKPTSGTVTVSGRVSALLELGAGFNPEFTGRENVYFQGALMGFTRAQMDEKFDDIAAFADIGGFVDQPVRMYSSGMFVRLAFATGIHVSPDILIIDEALSVGDERFQRKCFQRMQTFRNGGGTVLFVSHNTNMVASYCDRTVLLDQGKLLMHEEPGPVIDAYRELVAQLPNECVEKRAFAGAELRVPYFAAQGDSRVATLSHGERYELVLDATFLESAKGVAATASVRLKNGFVLGTFEAPAHPDLTIQAGEEAQFRLPFLCTLLPGVYALDCTLEGVSEGRRQCIGAFRDMPLRVANNHCLASIGAVSFSPPNG